MLPSIITLIIDTVAGIFAGALLLRFWTQAIHIRPPNVVAEFVFHLTDWLVKPLRRVVPGVGGYDWASLIGVTLTALIAATLELALQKVFLPSIIALFTVQFMLSWIIYGFIAFLLVGCIFSWINPQAPMAPFFCALNEPILRPLRRLIKPIGNIDITPMVAILLLNVALRVVVMLPGFFK